jgi:hypothetical protein
VLLLIQTSLVAAGRTDIHRRLGYFGAAIATLMPVVGITAALDAARRGSAPPGIPPLAFLTVPVGDILVFSILVACGFYWRRKPETHKRLMLLATLSVLVAAVARLPFAFILRTGPLAFFGLTDLFLVAFVFYDVSTRRRVHPVYLWGGLLLVASQPLRLLIVGTNAWLSFAHWLVG